MIRVVANSVGIPLKSTVDGLKISERMFGSIFQAIFLVKNAGKYFNKFSPSLQKVNKKWKSTIQKRTCWKCGKYNSPITAMNSHNRTLDGYENESHNEEPEEDEDEDEENEEDYIEVEFIGDDEADENI